MEKKPTTAEWCAMHAYDLYIEICDAIIGKAFAGSPDKAANMTHDQACNAARKATDAWVKRHTRAKKPTKKKKAAR